MLVSRTLLVALVLSLAGCGKKKVEAADAGSGDILTPGGTVNPTKMRDQVNDTLQQEHEKTLEPKVE